MSKIIFNGVDYAGGSGNYFNPVIYSDVERVIGVWRDNKPLYKRTWKFNSTTIINANTWTSLGISGGDMENIIFSETVDDEGRTNKVAYCGVRNSYVSIYSTFATNVLMVTLYYTKTTDVAGSGDYNTYGVPTVHYDTNEQVIGTWTNGKPLYEITVEVNSVNHNDWTDVFSLADADIKGYDSRTSYAQLNNGERVQLDWFVTTSIYNRSIITNSGTKFRVETQGNNYSKIVATIQYTKNTDT